MRDGSDAIADWPILNALLNVAAGATWVSVHHGGGVGIGNSIHAGMVVVADGTDDAAERLERVLTADPGTGVMRHLDAGYPEARRGRGGARLRSADGRRRNRVSVPGATRLLIRDLEQLVTPAGRGRTASWTRARGRRLARRCLRALRGRRDRLRRSHARPACSRRRRRGARRKRALRDPRARRLHTHPAFAATGSRSSRCARPARATRSCTQRAAASLDRAGDARGVGGRARAGRSAARGLDAPRRNDHVRGEVGLRPRPRHRARVAQGCRRGGRCPDVARRAFRSARVRRRGRVSGLRALGGLPEAAGSRRRPTSSSSAEPSTRHRHGATSRRVGGRPLAPAPR